MPRPPAPACSACHRRSRRSSARCGRRWRGQKLVSVQGAPQINEDWIDRCGKAWLRSRPPTRQPINAETGPRIARGEELKRLAEAFVAAERDTAAALSDIGDEAFPRRRRAALQPAARDAQRHLSAMLTEDADRFWNEKVRARFIARSRAVTSPSSSRRRNAEAKTVAPPSSSRHKSGVAVGCGAQCSITAAEIHHRRQAPDPPRRWLPPGAGRGQGRARRAVPRGGASAKARCRRFPSAPSCASAPGVPGLVAMRQGAARSAREPGSRRALLVAALAEPDRLPGRHPGRGRQVDRGGLRTASWGPAALGRVARRPRSKPAGASS